MGKDDQEEFASPLHEFIERWPQSVLNNGLGTLLREADYPDLRTDQVEKVEGRVVRHHPRSRELIGKPSSGRGIK